MPFPYALLPTGVDAIRILTVEPGNFSDPLVCTLTPKTFSDKPKYVALSYTWGSSYPDNSRLPISPNASSDHVTLKLNGQLFRVEHNLYLALLHLRSPTYPIAIWADAICINQADTEERNQQVSLMSFIYTRAEMVVAWLGTRDYPSILTASLFTAMFIDWSAGRTQDFSAVLAGASKLRCSPKPDQGTFARIAESTYWTRLWIVQETCLPRLLFLVYGSNIWTYEEFRQWVFQAATAQSWPYPIPDGHRAMLRLLETRDERHTDMMTFESLIERFGSSECSDPRDKVYGLLGCANDIYPFTKRDDKVDSLEDYINSLTTGAQLLPELRRGSGSFRVNYSRSFYDIWTNVVYFVFFRAKTVEHRVSYPAGNEGRSPRDAWLNEERRISIVRTAGIVQNALCQKVEEEVLASHGHHLNERDPPVIRAMGYIAGEIVRLGPEYESLIASSRAQWDWTSCWADHYQTAKDLEMLRRIDEKYAAKIMHYEKRDVDRIREIRNPDIAAWCVDLESCRTSDPRYVSQYETMWCREVDEEGPRICLGTGHVIALVPPAAKVGDVIVRFWNCDAAIVMRPVKRAETERGSPWLMLVGRTDVAEVCDRKAMPSSDPHAERHLAHDDGDHIYVDLNLRTLQMITAYIAT